MTWRTGHGSPRPVTWTTWRCSPEVVFDQFWDIATFPQFPADIEDQDEQQVAVAYSSARSLLSKLLPMEELMTDQSPTTLAAPRARRPWLTGRSRGERDRRA